jgi:ABC-2 type transport system permease protein
MKGLILKDIYNLKRQYKVLLLLLVFYTGFSLFTGDAGFLTGVLSLMMVMLTITTLAYDERSKWEKFALTMPVSRKDLVLGKYLLGFLLSVAAFIMNLVFLTVAPTKQETEALPTAAATLGISLFFLCVILPVLFKFGVEKGRMLMMLIFFVPTGIILLLSKTELPSISEGFMRLLPYLCILFMVIIAYVSVQVSLAIYRKKEM